jgi:hypothetical protein
VGRHHGAAGLLVERVLAQRGRRHLHRGVRGAQLDARRAPADPGPAQQPAHVAAHLQHPGVLPLAGQRHLDVEHPGGLLGTGRGQRVAAVPQFRLGRLHQLGGLVQVDRHPVGEQPVGGGRTVDPVPPDGSAHPGHQRGHVAVGALGRVALPERLDDGAQRHQLPEPDGEQRQHPPGVADRHRDVNRLEHERAEQAQPQRAWAHER